MGLGPFTLAELEMAMLQPTHNLLMGHLVWRLVYNKEFDDEYDFAGDSRAAFAARRAAQAAQGAAAAAGGAASLMFSSPSLASSFGRGNAAAAAGGGPGGAGGAGGKQLPSPNELTIAHRNGGYGLKRLKVRVRARHSEGFVSRLFAFFHMYKFSCNFFDLT